MKEQKQFIPVQPFMRAMSYGTPKPTVEKKESSDVDWYKKAQDETEKIMYIMRGLPGSGKSSVARELGKGGAILSTDDFFMIEGEYKYDPSMIGYAHTWNQGRADQAIKAGVSPIVIDNTNVAGWQAKPYVERAVANGYRVEVKEPTTSWKFNAEELAEKNTHEVPLDVIQQMVRDWEPNLSAEDILNSEKPKD